MQGIFFGSMRTTGINGHIDAFTYKRKSLYFIDKRVMHVCMSQLDQKIATYHFAPPPPTTQIWLE